MEIFKQQVQVRVPVLILKIEGKLDGSNYQELIREVEKEYASGARDLLLDMNDVTFMSSSGLVALHSLALLMRGEQPLDPEAGWSAIHAFGEYIESSQQMEKHFKLLNPQARVEKTLSTTGFDKAFEVFYDREAALASF